MSKPSRRKAKPRPAKPAPVDTAKEIEALKRRIEELERAKPKDPLAPFRVPFKPTPSCPEPEDESPWDQPYPTQPWRPRRPYPWERSPWAPYITD